MLSFNNFTQKIRVGRIVSCRDPHMIAQNEFGERLGEKLLPPCRCPRSPLLKIGKQLSIKTIVRLDKPQVIIIP